MSDRVLMYHALESDAFPSEAKKKGDLLYILSEDTFENQLKLIQGQGYEVVSNENDFEENKVRTGDFTVELTFDDGHFTNHTLAYPLLMKYGYKACFFVTTGWLNGKSYMTDGMLRELADSGMLIGTHGASHRFLTDLTDDEVSRELDTSKKYIEDKLGCPVKTFSAPGGRIDERVARIAVKAGYTDIYISDNSPGFSVEGVDINGRIAVKRNYDLNQFKRSIITGKSPESALVTSALSLAKGMLGNRNYQYIRELALRFKK